MLSFLIILAIGALATFLISEADIECVKPQKRRVITPSVRKMRDAYFSAIAETR